MSKLKKKGEKKRIIFKKFHAVPISNFLPRMMAYFLFNFLNLDFKKEPPPFSNHKQSKIIENESQREISAVDVQVSTGLSNPNIEVRLSLK